MNERRIERTKRFLDSVKKTLEAQDRAFPELSRRHEGTAAPVDSDVSVGALRA